MSDLPESGAAVTLQTLSRALSILGLNAPSQLGIHHDPRLDELITTLPKLTEANLDGPDGVCPICLVQFRALLAEEETALAMDSPANAVEDLGVTRLENTCRHIFCRKDISTWIRQGRNSCPTCRRPLLDPLPVELGQHNALNPEAATQMADEVIQEILAVPQVADDVIQQMLAALRPIDGQPSSDHVVAARRLMDAPDPGTLDIEAPYANDETYPERSEFGMYS